MPNSVWLPQAGTPADLTALDAADGSAPTSLRLDGHLPRPGVFDRQAVSSLPRQELGPTAINCFSGRAVTRADSFAGVRLLDLLDAAGFSSLPRSEQKRCVVIAQGHDDYRAVFSWSELYNSPLGPQVLVLYERDGRPLDARLGPLCLISAGDRQLGPRHLRGLEAVAVHAL